jgi:hypothetical protein
MVFALLGICFFSGSIFAQDSLKINELKQMKPQELSAMLMMAVAGKINSRDVKMLVSAGADVNFADDFSGNTPLHLTMLSFGAGKAKVVGFLIKNGGNVNIQNKKGQTPLHLLCSLASALSKESTEKEFLVTARGLARRMKNLDITDKEGQTALHVACGQGLPRLVSMLLAQGANPDVKDNNGESPIFKALELPRKGSREIVQKLMEKGADLNVTNKDGLTPAAYARKSLSSLANLFPASGKADPTENPENCRKNRSFLTCSIECYNLDNSDMIENVPESDWAALEEKLKNGQYLKSAEKCPAGGIYSLVNGFIKCSKHPEE